MANVSRLDACMKGKGAVVSHLGAVTFSLSLEMPIWF